jgi:phenylalanyl-tRNA synthetase beta subunit
MVYRSSEGTLTEAEVAGLHERVVAHLVRALGVEVRG